MSPVAPVAAPYNGRTVADLPISQPGRSQVVALTDPDRLFAPETLTLARAFYSGVKDLPIVSPHGHTDPRWYALNEPFSNGTG